MNYNNKAIIQRMNYKGSANHSKIEFETTDLFVLLRKLFLDEVLHDDAVQSDIATGQHLLADQLGIDELLELVLTLRLDLGQQTLVHLLLQLVDLLHVPTRRTGVHLDLLTLLLLLLRTQTRTVTLPAPLLR
jgi:hypothetical protein